MIDDELEALWSAVIDNRDDLAPRLILADALLERGDSRGELIHLQCDGHPTLRATDADEPSSVYMTATDRAVTLGERGHELVASSWRAWFPELSTIVRQRGSWFHEGMLHGLRPHGTIEGWRVVANAHRRELVTVRKVRGQVGSDRTPPDPDLYIYAITHLPHEPTWIDIDTADIGDALYHARRTWRTVGLRLGSVWASEVRRAFPDIEHLELKSPFTTQLHNRRITSEEAALLLESLHEARAVFPKLRTIAFSGSWLQIRLTQSDRELTDKLRRLGVTI